MNAHRLNLLALCGVTVAALVLIFALSEGTGSSRQLIHAADPSTLVYQLDAHSSGLTDLVAARRSLDLAPDNSLRALRLSRLALERYRITGNTRFLGVAKVALLPWWNEPEPALEIWLTRGRIQQTEHQFVRAARDLAALNFRHPGNIEALMLETDAWRRAGEIAASKRSCIKLALAGRVDLTHYCSAEILLSVGRSRQAQVLLEKIVPDANSLSIDERNWAHSIYADSLLANGELQRAASVWKNIMQTPDAPLSYRLAYADLLLSLEDWPSVIELLQNDRNTTAVLLRLAIAAKNSHSADYPGLYEQLANQFKILESNADGERYQRDRAIYTLSVLDDAVAALDLALGNWALQKGWEDTELVLHIARITGNDEVLRDIERWRKTADGGA